MTEPLPIKLESVHTIRKDLQNWEQIRKTILILIRLNMTPRNHKD